MNGCRGPSRTSLCSKSRSTRSDASTHFGSPSDLPSFVSGSLLVRSRHPGYRGWLGWCPTVGGPLPQGRLQALEVSERLELREALESL